ncbi:TPA: restriction endonuclease subunit S [Vibrio parahaemolyticus]|nr:restriction endonuclease subunit S [Vibrio parahaemolyticus]HCE3432330.1 restriction endonuclease subunit S [Vibrio parahaemolyticus]HCG7276800.1 restriction endonuclease subunit S [Vibrio parahaemolyticus]HCM0732445.1 restriction endonuclease subunit S [Vibrio parahaemolyticus]
MGFEYKNFRLGDIATFAYGKMPKKNLLGTGEFITFSGYKYLDSYPEKNASVGDLIVVARGVGGTGDVKLVEQECYLTNLSIKISLDNEIILNEYFYYMFRLNNLRYLDSGSAQSQITIADLSNVQLEIPSISAQKFVIVQLKTLDNKITLNRQINQTLEQMAQTLFKSWFVDFDPVIDNALDAGNAIPDELQARAEQRQALRHAANEANAANQPHSTRTNPAAGDALASTYKPLPDDIRQLFPNEFEESELGWVPKGWVVKTCEEIAERIGMGPFGSNIKTSTFVSSGVPIINGQQLKGFLVEETFANFLTPEHAEKLSNSIVKPGDIVFTHRGTIGQVSLIPSQSSYDKYIVSQSQFFLRPNVEILGSYYIECFFKSALGQQRLLSNASQVGVPAIARPSSHLKQLKILVPSYDTQDYFETLVGTYIESIVLRNKELKTLTKLRDTLLPKLISGELRLDEVESTIAETTA